jgi:hypothetical protein
MTDKKTDKKKEEYVVTDKLTANIGEILREKYKIKRTNSAGKNSDYDIVTTLNFNVKK